MSVTGQRSARRRLSVLTPLADVVTLAVAYEIAFAVFTLAHGGTIDLASAPPDWDLLLGLLAVALAFLWLGLYKPEVYVSRPLHLVTLLKGSVVALVVTAFFAFSLKSPVVSESRLTVFTAFSAFFVLTTLARIWILDRVFRADARRRPGGSVVVGASAECAALVVRCRQLRGFAPVVTLEPLDVCRDGKDAEPRLLQALAAVEPAPRQVLLDGAGLGCKAIFDVIGAARELGAEVYVTGPLAGPLDTTRLLARLFGTPAMHVRHEAPGEGAMPAGKRAFDVGAAAAALALLSPLLALLALAVKWSSPGPVFFRQQRVGLRGRTFEMLKFRTMEVDTSDDVHRDYVGRFISGGEAAGLDERGEQVYKLADDERVTRVGRFLRKYSVDELPQIWYVLRGDMSMVGPRPALAYEVAAYRPWHRRRLALTPGMSGLWQVAGRSRVGFDEMVFQDVIYGYNRSLGTDLSICLRTVPVMLMGQGGA